MWSEILRVKPKLDNSDANRMERSLTQRFTRVAKKFGKGLGSILKGGGIAGIGLALIDKILNPLQDTQDSIDKMLAKADQISDMSEQFGTTEGRLFKLQALAQAKGLEAGELNLLIGKFQTAVAEAIADPSKATSVRQFAKPGQDTAESFFKFIQSMQSLSKDKQILVQKEVFGEKQILKAADFLNTKNFQVLADMMRLQSAEFYTQRIKKGASLANYEDALASRRDSEHFSQGIGKINPNMIETKDRAEAKKLQKEREKYGFYQSMQRLDKQIEAIKTHLEMLVLGVGTGNLKVMKEQLLKLPTVQLMRGINPFKDEN